MLKSSIHKPARATVAVNYRVPEDVKRAFNETFQDRNKSAVIAELMQRAVEEERGNKQRSRAVDVLLALRAETPPVAAEDIQAAREEVRTWP